MLPSRVTRWTSAPTRQQRCSAMTRVVRDSARSGRRRAVTCRAAAAADDDLTRWGRIMLGNGLVDYYEALGVDDDAPSDEIKRAYRALAKECHPDYLGEKGHNICVLLNEAYTTLMDPAARAAYNARLEVALADEADTYTGKPLSKWMPSLSPRMAKNTNPQEDRAVFVDEGTCIGCKQCVWCAPATFRIEPDYGRSRVYAQWLNKEDDLQAAIDACPVSCIHWVSKQDLPALEYVMQHRTERVNVAVMMGQGSAGGSDVFAATQAFLKERRRKEEAQARAKRAYSPAQEAARREAAEVMMRSHLGFFANLFGSVLSSMESAVNGTGGDLRVGNRRRRVNWREREGAVASDGAGGGGAGYFLVPPERALVPIAVYADRAEQ